MLLQVLYSVRSERQLVEQNNCNLLFRWFVGLSIEDGVSNHSVNIEETRPDDRA
ncbi:transposase [Variovorax sp. GrIS 2.14]|jgi:transposase